MTITREADGTWWATFVVEVPKRVTAPVKNRVAAIDLGLESFAAIVYSDGTREKIANPRFLRESERKLARAQKNLSRKAKGSNNREKARVQVARAYAGVRNQRLNHARQLAARLIRENQTIVIESLNIAGMAKTRLGKSINDAAWRNAAHPASLIDSASQSTTPGGRRSSKRSRPVRNIRGASSSWPRRRFPHRAPAHCVE